MINTSSLGEIKKISPRDLIAIRDKRLNLYLEKFKVDPQNINLTYHIFEFNGEDYWLDNEKDVLDTMVRLCREPSCMESQIVLNIARIDNHTSLGDAEIPLVIYERDGLDNHILKERKSIIRDHYDSKIFKIMGVDGDCETNSYIYADTRDFAVQASLEIMKSEEHILTEMNIFEYLIDLYDISMEHAHDIVEIALGEKAPRSGGSKAA